MNKMLLFSNIKKYDLMINKYFLPRNIIHYVNNVDFPTYLAADPQDEQNIETKSNNNYILDLPDRFVTRKYTYRFQIIDVNCHEYRKNEKYYRENGPVIIGYFTNGKIQFKSWYHNNKLHRENNLPAFIQYHDNGKIILEMWLQNGELHRKFIPAKIVYDENGRYYSSEYWENGKKINKIITDLI